MKRLFFIIIFFLSFCATNAQCREVAYASDLRKSEDLRNITRDSPLGQDAWYILYETNKLELTTNKKALEDLIDRIKSSGKSTEDFLDDIIAHGGYDAWKNFTNGVDELADTLKPLKGKYADDVLDALKKDFPNATDLKKIVDDGLVDSWKKLDVLNDNAFRNLKKDPDFLKKFDDVVKNDGLNKHVLEGDISYEILETGQKKWKVGGVHHKTAFDNSTARIKPGTKSTPNANGYYTAKIEVYHPEFPDNGGFKVKSKESTFFPDDWSVDKLQAEIAGAIKNKGTPTVYPDGRKLYKGTMTDGAELAIWENAAGNITSTYPVL